MAGKSLNDLALSDAPIHPVATDPRSSEWYRFCRDIDDLLATGKVTYAESTLTDIQQTVERTQWVTEGQRKAVDNIEAGGQRGKRWGEGFARRYR